MAALLAVPFGATGQAAAPLPGLLIGDFDKTFSIRPSEIIVSGDGSAIIAGSAAWIGGAPSPRTSQFGHVAWRSWTATRATGDATLWLDNCKPDCAGGTDFPTAGILTASRVRNGHFTHLALRSGGKTITWTLQRAPLGYVWGGG